MTLAQLLAGIALLAAPASIETFEADRFEPRHAVLTDLGAAPLVRVDGDDGGDDDGDDDRDDHGDDDRDDDRDDDGDDD